MFKIQDKVSVSVLLLGGLVFFFGVGGGIRGEEEASIFIGLHGRIETYKGDDEPGRQVNTDSRGELCFPVPIGRNNAELRNVDNGEREPESEPYH